MYGLHTQGVLSGQSGDGGHAVATQRGKSFQIGLNARTAAGVGACDGQDTGIVGMGRHIHGIDYQRVDVYGLLRIHD
jgi:hypothetical protein